MMTEYNINLIRDRVLAKPYRKMLFWGILIYILLCGIGLAFVVHRSTVRIVDASRLHREMKVAEEQFLLSHPEANDLGSYAKGLRPRLIEAGDILVGIDQGLNPKLNLATILLGLADPLPSECVLVSVDLYRTKKEVRFSVLTPVNSSTSRLAGQLIDLWKSGGLLEAQLKDIRAESSRREYRAGRSVNIHSFVAKIGSV